MRKKFNVGGQEVSGEDVEFEVERESFNIYILHDGTKLKLKVVVSNIVRLDSYGPDNNPLYAVQATNVLVPDVPENLRKKQ
jgi:hypothetical protein